jgi:hypothetical protein
MNAMPPNKAIVKTNSDSFWSERDIIRISDDRCAVIYRVNVLAAAGEEEHLVVYTLPHSISQAEYETVSRNLRETNLEAIISFHIADREGWAQVITTPDEDMDPFDLAAAIAVIKASCGWDESLPIVIEIDGAEIRVWPRFDGQHWVVEDRKDANCEGLP